MAPLWAHSFRLLTVYYTVGQLGQQIEEISVLDKVDRSYIMLVGQQRVQRNSCSFLPATRFLLLAGQIVQRPTETASGEEECPHCGATFTCGGEGTGEGR